MMFVGRPASRLCFASFLLAILCALLLACGPLPSAASPRHERYFRGRSLLLRVQDIDHGDVSVLVLKGDLDSSSDADDMKHAVEDAKNKRVVLDMHGVRSFGDDAAKALVSAYTHITNDGGKLVLADISDSVYEKLQATQLLSVFEVHHSVNDALEDL